MPRGRAGALIPKARINVTRTPPTLLTRLPGPRPEQHHGPKLWNAKRKIKTNLGIGEYEARASMIDPQTWWSAKHADLADGTDLSTNSSPNSTRKPRSRKEEIRTRLGNWWQSETGRQWQSCLQDPRINGQWWRLDQENLVKLMNAHPFLQQHSEDVQEFIVAGSINLDGSKIQRLLTQPATYFSIPHHVPLSQREQVYFPKVDDTVTLLRTPHLGPRYAAFEVPLTFNKIDFKAYLADVYDVDVLHIRSVVIQGKVDRQEGRDRYSQGPLTRHPNRKKMTCLLVKPFVYPKEPETLEDWDQKDYWTSMKSLVASQRVDDDWGMKNPNKEHNKSIAAQAKALLRGEKKWTPTWQNFPEDWRAMHGLDVNEAPTQQQGQNRP